MNLPRPNIRLPRNSLSGRIEIKSLGELKVAYKWLRYYDLCIAEAESKGNVRLVAAYHRYYLTVIEAITACRARKDTK